MKFPVPVAFALAAFLSADSVHGFVASVARPIASKRQFDKNHFPSSLESSYRLPSTPKHHLPTVHFSKPPSSIDHETKFLVRKGALWIIFGSILTGIHEGCLAAALHNWLSIDSWIWNAMSVGVPGALIWPTLCYLLRMFYWMSSPSSVVDMMEEMKAKETQDFKLNHALRTIYDKADIIEADANRKLPPHVHQSLPKLCVIPDKEHRAGILGFPKNAIVCISQGALDELTFDEISGVLAHEVGHLYHKHVEVDIEVLATLRGPQFLSRCGLFLMGYGPSRMVGFVLFFAGGFVYSSGWLLFKAFCRMEEYEADAFAKSIGNGPALASALKKKWDDSPLDSPFGLLLDHPSPNDRIKRLQEGELEEESPSHFVIVLGAIASFHCLQCALSENNECV